MATVKAYTDLNQSKKLAGILPPESADMWWAERYAGRVMPDGRYVVEENPVYYLSLTKPSNSNYSQDTIKDIACWSAASLIEVLEGRNSLELGVKYNDGQYYLFYMDDWCSIIAETSYHSSLVDACYEMVLKLHELKML